MSKWLPTDEIILEWLNEFYKSRVPLTLNTVMPSDRFLVKSTAKKIAERLDNARKSGKTRGACIGNLDSAVDELLKEIEES
jgi:hypothetical protein